MKAPLLENLDKKSTYLLGCSFGPDSMMLLHLLKEQGFKTIVAMVNYQMRPEATNEENALRKYCQDNEIPFFLKRAKYHLEYGNFQSWARDFRYSYFNELYQRFDAQGLLLGHHLDDSIETYVMQKRKGLNLFYYGIKPVTRIMSMRVYRPLITATKQEILEYCNQSKVPYATDQSNFSNRYQRNLIRNNYLLHLSKEAKDDLIEEMRQKNQELETIQAKIDKQFSPFETIDIKSLESLNNIERSYLFYKFFTRVFPPKMYKSKYTLEIEKLISSHKPNAAINLKQYYIQREYHFLRIIDKKDLNGYQYFLEKPVRLETPYFIIDFTKQSDKILISSNDFPLHIRTMKRGDRYRIHDYYVEVRRLFIDWKMPVSLRQRWPLVVNKNGEILYIPRYQVNYQPNDNSFLLIK
ncbi:MAG: tRNA lysidine(34) synthetase TilS [Erysipelotrichaceae bacterium]|jgi:tRNA(Ile)-lysidine synthase|nr:tRNA lysidine(34) synthetase TilS [Erysipelotrichaceae bacterium]